MLNQQTHFVGRLAREWINCVDTKFFANLFWKHVHQFAITKIVIHQTARYISNAMPSKRGFTQCGGIIGRKGAGYFDYVVAFCPLNSQSVAPWFDRRIASSCV